RIVIFDEATSALDNRTQAVITESLNKLQATRIVIAHRLSTIRNASSILVLEDGEVAESGSHDQLVLNTGGLYSKLQKLQRVDS
ncbi:MAG: ABC transporter, partial [Bacteroidota bacterium]